MKKAFKAIITNILGWQVRRLREKNKILIIGVVGSIGKTSTKFGIAKVLGQNKKIQFQEGNYNDIVSVPLIFFGHQMPNILNVLSWLRIIVANERMLIQPYPYELVVVELGTDGPGQIIAFQKYLHLDYAVVTAITPEHMEFFSSLDDVANEELSVARLADKLLINKDLCEDKYLKSVNVPVITYGTDTTSDYLLSDIKFTNLTATFKVTNQKKELKLNASMNAVSNAELYSVTSAIAIAHMTGLSLSQIEQGIERIVPVAGRMQRLKGVKNSLIIDETYNASPVAVKAALDSLYIMEAKQKIAILGNMNELGSISAESHKEIGRYCDPKQLDFVVTIGPDANRFIAEEAKLNGCNVASFDNPYDAGEFIRNRLKHGAVVLAKGSQNGVFAEEAVKMLLRNPEDETRLVRQTPEWLKKKARNFNG